MTGPTPLAVPDESDRAMARAVCDHFYASHCYRGMSIRLCMTCHEPDWDDLAEQLREAVGEIPTPEPLSIPADERAAIRATLEGATITAAGFPAAATASSGPVSGEAVTAALLADVEFARTPPRPAVWQSLSTARARVMLEAAAPFIRAADAAKLAAITDACRSIPTPIAERIRAIIVSGEAHDG